MQKCLNCDNQAKIKFCSRNCAASYNNRLYHKREKIPRFCRKCGDKVERKTLCPKCSPYGLSRTSCYRKGINPNKCLVCDKDVKGNFCSNKCQQKYYFINTVIPKAELDGFIDSKHKAKRYLEHKFGYQCAICNTKEWCGKPLVMILDHIDGNADNNNLVNLRLVCSNCDSQLPTYKGRNKGNGRFKRRERYANNQSY